MRQHNVRLAGTASAGDSQCRAITRARESQQGQGKSKGRAEPARQGRAGQTCVQSSPKPCCRSHCMKGCRPSCKQPHTWPNSSAGPSPAPSPALCLSPWPDAPASYPVLPALPAPHPIPHHTRNNTQLVDLAKAGPPCCVLMLSSTPSAYCLLGLLLAPRPCCRQIVSASSSPHMSLHVTPHS